MPRLRQLADWLSPRPEANRASSATKPGEPGPAPSAPEIPGGSRLAEAIMVVVLCSYVVVQVIDAVTAPSPTRGFRLAVGITTTVVLFALTVSATSASAERWPRWRRLATLLAEALITYLPLVVLGSSWAYMAGFFAGSALLLLSGWAAWALFTAVVASMLTLSLPAMSNLGAYDTANLTLSTLVLGLVIFGLARLSLAIRYVHATRGELAQLAIIRERTRFARDLHDLLGYSLSAITLKAELTRRIVARDPAGARDELAEVVDIARQALDDVRMVSSGYRNVSLAKEASSVTSLLAAGDIHAHVEIACGALDEKVDTVLATILREAVTNTLRHSSARNCMIEADVAADTVRLMVRNDGVPDSAAEGRRGGGLENLRTRLESIGGALTVEKRGDGWFTVLAEAPLEPMTALAPDSGNGAGPGAAARTRWRRRATRGV